MELTFGFLLGGGRGEIKIWWGESLLGGKFFLDWGMGKWANFQLVGILPHPRPPPIYGKRWSIISYKKLTKETQTSWKRLKNFLTDYHLSDISKTAMHWENDCYHNCSEKIKSLIIINFLKHKTAESKIRNIIWYANFNRMIVIKTALSNQKLKNQFLKNNMKGNQKYHMISIV